MEEKGEAAGFFPFQRGHLGIGKPVGGPMCDYQGVVARPGLTWNAEELVRGCGLAAWDFDHLVASQQAFQPYHYSTEGSPYLDLSSGFEAYRLGRQRAGSDTVKKGLRKRGRLEVDIGPLHFETHTTDPSVFAKLLEWKSAQV